MICSYKKNVYDANCLHAHYYRTNISKKHSQIYPRNKNDIRNKAVWDSLKLDVQNNSNDKTADANSTFDRVSKIDRGFN